MVGVSVVIWTPFSDRVESETVDPPKVVVESEDGVKYPNGVWYPLSILVIISSEEINFRHELKQKHGNIHRERKMNKNIEQENSQTKMTQLQSRTDEFSSNRTERPRCLRRGLSGEDCSVTLSHKRCRYQKDHRNPSL